MPCRQDWIVPNHPNKNQGRFCSAGAEANFRGIADRSLLLSKLSQSPKWSVSRLDFWL
jgi:hypothetical protein